MYRYYIVFTLCCVLMFAGYFIVPLLCLHDYTKLQKLKVPLGSHVDVPLVYKSFSVEDKKRKGVLILLKATLTGKYV